MAVAEVPAPRLSDVVASTKIFPRKTIADNATKRSATPEKLQRLLRGDLDNILAKALKKRPAERYATVNAFADDLRRFRTIGWDPPRFLAPYQALHARRRSMHPTHGRGHRKRDRAIRHSAIAP